MRLFHQGCTRAHVLFVFWLCARLWCSASLLLCEPVTILLVSRVDRCVVLLFVRLRVSVKAKCLRTTTNLSLSRPLGSTRRTRRFGSCQQLRLHEIDWEHIERRDRAHGLTQRTAAEKGKFCAIGLFSGLCIEFTNVSAQRNDHKASSHLTIRLGSVQQRSKKRSLLKQLSAAMAYAYSDSVR